MSIHAITIAHRFIKIFFFYFLLQFDFFHLIINNDGKLHIHEKKQRKAKIIIFVSVMDNGICIGYRYPTFSLHHNKLFLKYGLNNKMHSVRKHFEMDNLLLNEKGQLLSKSKQIHKPKRKNHCKRKRKTEKIKTKWVQCTKTFCYLFWKFASASVYCCCLLVVIQIVQPRIKWCAR